MVRQAAIDGDITTKVCKVCKIEKQLTDFHPNKACKLGVVGTCTFCTNQRITQWYADNRSRRQEYANQRNQSRKNEVIEHFGNKCFDCNRSYHRCVYQFHHLDPDGKDVNPSKALTWKPERMWKELNKCIMLCANCHMIRHHGKEAINASSY